MIKFNYLIFASIALISIPLQNAASQDLPTSPFSIQRLNDYPLIQGRSPSTPAMAPDGSMIAFGWNKTGGRILDLWVMQYPSGDAKEIVKASQITSLPNQDDTRTKEEIQEQKDYEGGLSGFEWSDQSDQIAFSNKGRIWLVNPDGSNLHAMIDANVGASRPQFSPDGKYIAYSQSGNVWRFDRKSGAIKQLTFISKPMTSLDGFNWSPDSKLLSVQWVDNSKSGHATMIDFTKDRGKAVTIDRGWVGDQSENIKYGVVSAEGGLITFVTGIPVDSWGAHLAWSPKSDSIAIDWYSNDFQHFTISLASWPLLKATSIYSETAPKNFIPDWRPLLWSQDASRIIFGTDIIGGKFGFRSVLSILPNGKDIQKVFAENYDVGAVGRPKDSNNLILVTAGNSPLDAEIRILNPDGKTSVFPVVSNGYAVGKNFDDAALPLYSDDGKEIATEASTRILNSELYAVVPVQKRLTFSQTDDFKKIKWADIKEVSFPGPEGATLHGLLFTPQGMDMSKPHPAVVSDIYADSAKGSWGGFMENYMATNLNFVVLCVDFRASWGYGGDFDSGYYKKMGLIDADEAVDANKYLASLSYVNPKRIGIWGWSYGGFLTCMTLMTKPGEFYAGVAVAPVTDWTTYNEWYTERRLGLPKDNKEIYKKTSPITYASGLQDHLLICHGIVDNNVLFENTAIMTENLIRAGKYFDLMIFPKDDHSISRIHSRPYVMGRIVKYLDEWLTAP